MTSVTPQRHNLLEDVLALLSATLMIALAVNLYRHAGLLTGGTAGLAFLAQYGTRLSFGQAFFLINLPFYWLAVRRMGWAFTLRTLAAVTLVSLLTELTPHFVAFSALQPLYAAVMGGVLMGVGLLILFRHRTSLGGVNILALYAQERYGLRAGYVQLAIDGLILLASLFVVTLEQFALSLLATVMINLVIATNHKPGRYMGVS